MRADELSLLNGATVLAMNAGLGRGGEVQVDVSGSFLIEGNSPLNDSDPSGGISTSAVVLGLPGSPSETGPAGAITIAAEALVVGQFGRVISDSFSNAPAGPITLNVGTLAVKEGGEITSSAGAEGSGADIRITAQESVTVYGAHRDLPIDASEISADAAFSDADGKGGSILIQSPLLVLEQGGELSSETGSGGPGGAIELMVDHLVISSGGEINTSAFGSAQAGTIQIDANTVSINQEGSESLNPLLQETGLFSRASLDATGDAGTIRVTAASLIINGSEISITTNQTLSEKHLGSGPEGRIGIHAGNVHLDQGARITAESTGNVPASAVEIQARQLVMEGESRITTQSNDADAGPIRIGGDNVVLRDSLITTSVQGRIGNGGNITVDADALVLQDGFIQANTEASEARGGNIFIDTQALVASQNLLEVGGTERLTFAPGGERNVIQAAAPGGEQGIITLTAPELDISGSLVTLFTLFVDAPRLIRDPCAAAAGKSASSLVQRGRGGISAGPEAPSAVSLGGERLERLLDTETEPSAPSPAGGGESRSKSAPMGCPGAQ